MAWYWVVASLASLAPKHPEFRYRFSIPRSGKRRSNQKPTRDMHQHRGGTYSYPVQLRRRLLQQLRLNIDVFPHSGDALRAESIEAEGMHGTKAMPPDQRLDRLDDLRIQIRQELKALHAEDHGSVPWEIRLAHLEPLWRDLFSLLEELELI